VNVVGFVASNMLRGDVKTIDWDEVASLDRARDLILDVRGPDELTRGVLDGAVNIPLPQLRSRIDELPRDRRIVVYCQAGQRAYFACRMLTQRGFDAVNLSGGFKTYAHAVGRQSSLDVFEHVSAGDQDEER